MWSVKARIVIGYRTRDRFEIIARKGNIGDDTECSVKRTRKGLFGNIKEIRATSVQYEESGVSGLYCQLVAIPKN